MIFAIRILSEEAMTIRPYSQNPVIDLEKIFKLSNCDTEKLPRLSGELTFRNIQRARSLAAKAEDALTGLAENNQVEANNSDASAGRHRMVQVSDPGSQKKWRRLWTTILNSIRSCLSFLRDMLTIRRRSWLHESRSRHCRRKVISGPKTWYPVIAPA